MTLSVGMLEPEDTRITYCHIDRTGGTESPDGLFFAQLGGRWGTKRSSLYKGRVNFTSPRDVRKEIVKVVKEWIQIKLKFAPSTLILSSQIRDRLIGDLLSHTRLIT